MQMDRQVRAIVVVVDQADVSVAETPCWYGRSRIVECDAVDMPGRYALGPYKYPTGVMPQRTDASFAYGGILPGVDVVVLYAHIGSLDYSE